MTWVLGSQLTGVTEQVSDSTSLQVCVAGTSQEVQITPQQPHLSVWGLHPSSEATEEQEEASVPGVSWVHGAVFCGHNPIHTEVLREQITRSENCCYWPGPQNRICAVLERRIKLAVSNVQLYGTVCLQSRTEQCSDSTLSFLP